MNPIMRTDSQTHCVADAHSTTVVGLGSPIGDDQAGWRLVELLQRRPDVPARLKIIHEATQLVDELAGCSKLIIVDACRGGMRTGAISRLSWPDPRIRQYHYHSTHSVGLCNALQLAERLGRMPPSVEIFGIEFGNDKQHDVMTPEVAQAVAELEKSIFTELCETLDARTVVG
jgi:hydrogenase maturation protease